MTERISILGSTGSIGTQALDVVRLLNIKVVSLAAHSNVDLLEKQVREFLPQVVSVFQESSAKELKQRLKDIDVKVVSGLEGLCEAASLECCDLVLNAVVGMIGLNPTIAAINAKKNIALANKETLVVGGDIVTKLAKKNNVIILPVDSEHSAIFQCLQRGNLQDDLKRIILTASGGPFFGKKTKDLSEIKPCDALKHPNWKMGSKITIDSATLINKGLEIIEATWLFGVDQKEIDVVIHRESVVHSMIEYKDNSIIAQLGLPDMRIPIQYSITYPQRIESSVSELDLASIGKMSFYKPDLDTFIGINLCREAISIGGNAPAIVNGANEEAVSLFLNNKISFLDIGNLVKEALKNVKKFNVKSIEDVIETDFISRSFVREIL